MSFATVSRQQFELADGQIQGLKKGAVEFVDIVVSELVFKAAQQRIAGDAALANGGKKARVVAEDNVNPKAFSRLVSKMV